MGKTPTLSRTQLVEGLAHKLFNLYLISSGGIDNQPYLTTLWVTGRLEELNEALQQKLDRLTGGGK